MTVTRITTDTAPSYYSLNATFTFNGTTIGGIGGVFPLTWSDNIGLGSWPMIFADAPSTAGTLQVQVPDLNYLPSQDAGWVTCQGVMSPLKYSMAGTMQCYMTIKPNVLVTLFCFLSKYPLVSM